MEVRFHKARMLEVGFTGDLLTVEGEALVIKLGNVAELCIFQGNKDSPGYEILKRLRDDNGWTTWRNDTNGRYDDVDITFED